MKKMKNISTYFVPQSIGVHSLIKKLEKERYREEMVKKKAEAVEGKKNPKRLSQNCIASTRKERRKGAPISTGQIPLMT